MYKTVYTCDFLEFSTGELFTQRDTPRTDIYTLLDKRANGAARGDFTLVTDAMLLVFYGYVFCRYTHARARHLDVATFVRIYVYHDLLF